SQRRTRRRRREKPCGWYGGVPFRARRIAILVRNRQDRFPAQLDTISQDAYNFADTISPFSGIGRAATPACRGYRVNRRGWMRRQFERGTKRNVGRAETGGVLLGGLQDVSQSHGGG